MNSEATSCIAKMPTPSSSPRTNPTSNAYGPCPIVRRMLKTQSTTRSFSIGSSLLIPRRLGLKRQRTINLQLSLTRRGQFVCGFCPLIQGAHVMLLRLGARASLAAPCREPLLNGIRSAKRRPLHARRARSLEKNRPPRRSPTSMKFLPCAKWKRTNFMLSSRRVR